MQGFDVVRQLRSKLRSAKRKKLGKCTCKNNDVCPHYCVSKRMVADSGSCHDVLLRSLPQLQIRLSPPGRQSSNDDDDDDGREGAESKKNGPRSNGVCAISLSALLLMSRLSRLQLEPSMLFSDL